MFGISYNKALKIQRCQFYWYRRNLKYRGLKKMRRDTKPCPENIHPDQDMPVIFINTLVPRGGYFEHFPIRKGFRDDENDLAWYHIMERGLL